MPVRGNSDTLAGLLADEKTKSSDSAKSDSSGIDFGSALANVLGLFDAGAMPLAGNSDQLSAASGNPEAKKSRISAASSPGIAAGTALYSTPDLAGYFSSPGESLSKPASAPKESAMGSASPSELNFGQIDSTTQMNLTAIYNSARSTAHGMSHASKAGSSYRAQSNTSPAIEATADSEKHTAAMPQDPVAPVTNAVSGSTDNFQPMAQVKSGVLDSKNSTAGTKHGSDPLHQRSETVSTAPSLTRDSPGAAANQPAALKMAAQPQVTPQPSDYHAAAARVASPVPMQGLTQSHGSIGNPRVEGPTSTQPRQSELIAAPVRAANLKVELDAGDSVRASVREHAGVVDVRVIANDELTAQHLTGQIPELRRTLDASGMKLQSAQVSYRGNEHQQRSDSHQQEAQERKSEDDQTGIFTFEETSR